MLFLSGAEVSDLGHLSGFILMVCLFLVVEDVEEGHLLEVLLMIESIDLLMMNLLDGCEG